MCAMFWRSAVLVCVLLARLSSSQLPVCTRVQACTARVDSYPVIEEDTSGWGSGLVPLYDEAFAVTSFDYTQTPDTSIFELCACPNNDTCDSNDIVMLTFCEDVRTQLPLHCKGSRGLPRVIGLAHLSGKSSVSSVSSTAVFCTCPSGYERMRPEYWGGSEISISYKCK
ncbi:unnamed protein product [Heligmosomoides polygyrus]|uniref:Ganglioside GM2 activator n=1 Tax=Heligmosomoides polygyrus TaxID=6339 RepID=A0A3P8ALN3_HELPZ|nr:unnamed protein product [Heligmosomoides polygyrus]